MQMEQPPAQEGTREPRWAADFKRPELWTRRLFSELFGTFLLVLVGVGGAVAADVTHVPQSPTAAATAPALMVMAVILFMGKVGGAHLNPTVTLAFACRGEFPWRRVSGYAAAQLAGGLLACVFSRVVLGATATVGATVPNPAVSDLRAMVVEAVLTLGLVSTVLGTASSAQNVGALSAIAVGGYITLAGLWAGSLTGASMNPVRSLAPAIMRGDLGHSWVYVAGPLAGAALAVGCAILLRGPGRDPAATAAAQGE